MKIEYKKKRLRSNLIIGIVWTLLGIVEIAFAEELKWFKYGWLVFGILSLGIFFYQKYYQYLSIDNGVLTKHELISKQIRLADVNSIKKFAGDYTLKAADKELTINTQIITPKSFKTLQTALEKLDVIWK